jgi:4-oxalocrotonate tautomerase
MPVIQVDMFSGRTTDMKRQLVKALTDAFVEVTGARPQSVQVILRDVEKHDWGVAGSLCSDAQPEAPASGAGPSKT